MQQKLHIYKLLYICFLSDCDKQLYLKKVGYVWKKIYPKKALREIWKYLPLKNMSCKLLYKLEEQFQVLTLLNRNKRSIREFCFNLNILLVRGTLSKLLITILGISNVTGYTEKLNSKSKFYLSDVDYFLVIFCFNKCNCSASLVLKIFWIIKDLFNIWFSFYH